MKADVRVSGKHYKNWQIIVYPLSCHHWRFKCLSPDGGEPISDETCYLTQQEALEAAQEYLDLIIPGSNLSKRLDDLYEAKLIDTNTYIESLEWLRELIVRSI